MNRPHQTHIEVSYLHAFEYALQLFPTFTSLEGNPLVEDSGPAHQIQNLWRLHPELHVSV